ncbi:unnamed protein product, partial [Symbiodinium sp. KB8]
MMLGLVDALGGSSPADAHAARLAMCWVGAAADVHDARLGRRVGLGQPRLMLMMLEFGCAEAGVGRLTTAAADAHDARFGWHVGWEQPRLILMMPVLVAIMVPLTMSDFVGRLSGNGAAGRRTCREKPRLMFMMLGLECHWVGTAAAVAHDVRIGWHVGSFQFMLKMFARWMRTAAADAHDARLGRRVGWEAAHPVRDGSPVLLGEMAAKDLLHPSAAWLFHTGVSCSGETFCPPLANCYEDCRTSGEYDKACWQSSCCPSGTDAEYNRSDFHYYACTFTGNSCMERCNGWFQSRRCHDSKTFCPLLANCYEACRLSHEAGSCQDFEGCPGKAASFNDSSASFYLLALSSNRCLASLELICIFLGALFCFRVWVHRMENGTFLVTAAIVYASVIWFLPHRNAFYSLSVVSRTASHSTADATVQSRLQEYKQNHLPDWIPVFIKNGEIYFLVWSMLRLGGWTKPAYADFHLWSLLTTLVGLRWSCHPSAEKSVWHRRVVSTALAIACHLSQLDMPTQMGHVNGVAYVSLALFMGDPWFGLAVFAVFSPVKLMVLSQRSTWSTGLTLDLAWWVVNDLMTCIFLFSILQHIDILLGSVLQTAVDLEHQVREKEKSVRDRGHLLSATRRLLSVTCDCCETLSDDFEVVQPSQNILAMLHIQNPEQDSQLEPGISRLPLRQYICDEDQERFEQFIAASYESQAASSLHLRMKTRSGSPFEVQTFHVK